MNLPRLQQDILLIDDNLNNLWVLTDLLRSNGYQVRVANNGRRGLEAAHLARPDLIMLDISMPDLDGFEVCRTLKGDPALADVPVIFLSARWEGADKVKAFKVGGADFVQKPIHVQEVLTRVQHQLRLVSLQAELQVEHQSLVMANDALQAEVIVVKQLLSRLVEDGMATLPPDFRMETLATRRINGDVCAHQAGAPGIHFGMLCDPMGHGLMAGISEIPTMAAFTSLAAMDLPMTSMLAEINRKLFHLLPLGRFSCMILFRLDRHTGDLALVNAGMPNALLLRRDSRVELFGSTCLPLGIQEDLGSTAVRHLQLEPGDCFFACSDGLTDLLSEEEILGLFATGGEEGFPRLLKELLDERIQDRELSDDISWCLWPFWPDRVPRTRALASTRTENDSQEGLKVQLGFQPETFCYREVGPNLAAFLGRHGLPADVSRTLALLLSEAVVNAVEHGALEPGSDSEANDGPPGQVGIRLVIHQDAEGAFSRLDVQVRDPGPGFAWRQRLEDPPEASSRRSGRGLTLLKSLAEDFTFNEAGNVLSFSLLAAPAEEKTSC